MADGFGIVVHRFDYAVIDSNIEVGEDSFFMTSEHPSEISEGFKAAMSRPPEPTLEVFFCPGPAFVIPESSEHLLEKVSPHDLEIALKQVREGDLLLVCKVPGILQPDVFGPFKVSTASLCQYRGLHLAHLVNRLHEMTGNVKFVEYDHGFPAILVDDIDVVLPHVATHSLDSGRAIFPPPLEKPSQGVFIPVSATPYEPPPLQVIDIGMVSVSFLPANLINANEPDAFVAFPFSAIFHSRFHSCSDRVPGHIEELCDLIPWQHPRPEGQNGDQRKTDGLLSHTPGNALHPYPVFRTLDSPRTVPKADSNPPQRDMPPGPFFEFVLGPSTFSADTAGQLPSPLRVKIDSQFTADELSGNYTMVLDSQSCYLPR